jgi:hypothetical protein
MKYVINASTVRNGSVPAAKYTPGRPAAFERIPAVRRRVFKIQ